MDVRVGPKKKAEHQRINVIELSCWRRRLRVPWIARRSNQSILKEISSEYSLGGLMLKLKLQYFGHLMRLPCPSTIPGIYSNSCPSSQWCHPTISSSVIPFSSGLQSFPASGNFPKSQFFASGGQRIGVFASASVLPLNIQDWFPLGWTGWISLQSKGLSSVFSNMTVQ